MRFGMLGAMMDSGIAEKWEGGGVKKETGKNVFGENRHNDFAVWERQSPRFFVPASGSEVYVCHYS